MTAAERLDELGLTLPTVPAPAADYRPWTRAGDLVFTAGQLPMEDSQLMGRGLVGRDVTVPEAAALARTCALNVLAIAADAADGDLDRVRVVKLVVFVASAEGFTEQHLVANGASGLLAEVLGEAGRHARSAVGVPRLPLDSPVEVEAVFAV